MTKSFFFLIITSVILLSCSEQHVNQSEENHYVGVWESVSNSGSNAKTFLKINSENDSLSGYIEYSTLANSGLKQRTFGRSNLKGSFLENNVKISIIDSIKGLIGQAELFLEGDSLKFVTLADGIDFPVIYFKKITPSEAQQELFVEVNDNYWQKLRNRGVEFIATGNEPFWSVEINFNGKINFSTLSENEIIEVPVPSPIYGKEGRIVRYRAFSDSAEVDLVIQKMPCTDNMSGVTFENYVSVEVKRKEEIDSKLFEGCGTYLGDSRLHDIWALISIDNKAYETAMKNPERPYIELNLSTKQVLGNGGCNQFQGGFTLGNQIINFDDIISTMKHCDAMHVEQRLIQVISNQSLKYSIGSRELLLEGRNGNLKFKKVD
jgi:heat shock protein HslJ/uncharacterized membrane protein